MARTAAPPLVAPDLAVERVALQRRAPGGADQAHHLVDGEGQGSASLRVGYFTMNVSHFVVAAMYASVLAIAARMR